MKSRLKLVLFILLIECVFALKTYLNLEDFIRRKIERTIAKISHSRAEVIGLKYPWPLNHLHLDKLNIVSPDDATINIVQMTQIDISIDSHELLYGRWWIQDFSIGGIEWQVQRDRPSGYISSGRPRDLYFSSERQKNLDDFILELSDLPVSRLLDFHFPNDPIELIERSPSQTIQNFKDALLHLQEKRADFDRKVRESISLTEIETKIAEANNSKISTNPLIQKNLKIELDSLLAEQKKADDLFGQIKMADIKLKEELQGVHDKIGADVKTAHDLISLEKLNLNHISFLIFSPGLLEWVQKIFYDYELFQYFQGSSKVVGGVEIRRAEWGRDLYYIDPAQKPDFVLEKTHTEIKGVTGASLGLAGQSYSLDLEGISSDPRLFQKPSRLHMESSFRNFRIAGIDVDAEWDYTNEPIQDEVKVKLTKIHAADWPTGIAHLIPLKFKDGSVDANIEIHSSFDQIEIELEANFHDIDWDMSEVPRSGLIVPILYRTMMQQKEFTLNLSLRWPKAGEFVFDIQSSIDPIFDAEIQTKFQPAFDDYMSRVALASQSRVQSLEDQFNHQLKSFESEVLDEVEHRAASIRAGIASLSEIPK